MGPRASSDVAVVIPCHNAAPWLQQTLGSVLQQTLPPAELVLVDDGSTDASVAIAQRLGVRCHRQQCAGPAAARNAGVRATTAPLVAFLDADDCFVPEKLALQVAHLHHSGAAMSCTDAWVVEDGERVRRKNPANTPQRLDFHRLLDGNPVICSSVLVRRGALEAAGGFDEDPVLIATEDYDLWLRIAQSGAVAYLGQPLVEYRITPGQLSDDRRFARGIDRIMEKVCAVDSDPSVASRARRHRAMVRLSVAYHLAAAGGGTEARSWLAQARRLGMGWGSCWRTWLRSWL